MSKECLNLLKILKNKASALAARDDAAMDLAEFDDNEVLSGLLEVGSDSTEDEMLLASCGESIAEILLKAPNADFSIIDGLASTAQWEATALLKSRRPDLFCS